MGKGNTVTLKFTAFDVEPGGPKCNYDHLTIADGDGTVLMGRACGKSGSLVIGGKKVKSALPAAVSSRSNKVSVKFVTDDSGVRSGWSLTWQEVKKVTSDTGESITLAFLKICDEKGQRANLRLYQTKNFMEQLIGSSACFLFGTERGGGAVKITLCANLSTSNLHSIAFTFETCIFGREVLGPTGVIALSNFDDGKGLA